MRAMYSDIVFLTVEYNYCSLFRSAGEYCHFLSFSNLTDYRVKLYG